ncbi:hypothetical protein D9M68_852010 [compost metagenome]
MEQRGVGIETGQVVEVQPELGIGGGFRFQVRAADGDGAALGGHAVDAVMQLVQRRGLVAAADAALHGPVVVGAPHQINARADMAAEGFVVFIARAQG